MSVEQEPDMARQVEALADEMAVLAEKKAVVEKKIRELMAAEDYKAGVFYAREIFEAKQEKLVLETELEIVRRRRNRLLMPQ